MRVLFSCALFALVALHASNTFACASCGCGDPTLTVLGAEKPYRNRLRLALDGRRRTDRIGEAGVDRITLDEARLDMQAAWAPHERVFLLGSAPLLWRTVRTVNGGETETIGLGDVELRAKAFVYQDDPFRPRHLVALQAGLKFPTAPRQRDHQGALLPIEVQPGTGSWDPLIGASYALFLRPWSFYASAQAALPTRGTSDFRANRSLRLSATAQRQLLPQLAARLGLDARLDGKSIEGGEPERDSGGFIGFVSPELLISPLDDLLVVLSARIPTIQALSGHHREGIVLGAAVVYDF